MVLAHLGTWTFIECSLRLYTSGVFLEVGLLERRSYSYNVNGYQRWLMHAVVVSTVSHSEWVHSLQLLYPATLLSLILGIFLLPVLLIIATTPPLVLLRLTIAIVIISSSISLKYYLSITYSMYRGVDVGRLFRRAASGRYRADLLTSDGRRGWSCCRRRLDALRWRWIPERHVTFASDNSTLLRFTVKFFKVGLSVHFFRVGDFRPPALCWGRSSSRPMRINTNCQFRVSTIQLVLRWLHTGILLQQ